MGPLSFSYNYHMPERLSSQSILPNSLLNWEETRSTTWAFFKKNFFPSFLFPDLGKTEKSSQSNLQKFQNLFVNWEKLGSSA